MNLYRYAWSSPGIIWENGLVLPDGSVHPVTVPFAFENKEFRMIARELVAGTNLILPANKPEGINWPDQGEIPYTLVELAELLKNYDATGASDLPE